MTSPDPSAAARHDPDEYRLGAVAVDLAAGCLRRDGRELRLRKKTLDVLRYLLKRPGLVVSKQELIEALWPDTAVTDDALVQSIRELRLVLDDDHRNPRYIETLPKLGYRLIAPVQVGPAEHENTHAAGAVPIAADLPRNSYARHRLRPALVVVGFAALVMLLLLGVVGRPADGSRPAASAAPITRTTVSVGLFSNQSGQPDLDWLSSGVPDMLTAGLARSRALSVISRAQLETIRGRLGGSSAAQATLAAALALARGARSERVVLGSFKILGPAIRIDAQIYDVTSGALLGAESLTVEESQRLLRDIDLFALRLATRIGGGAVDEPTQTVGELLTENVDAYRWYSLALEQANAYHSAEALRFLERAIALDPRFAMAHARIAYVHMFIRVNDIEAARPHLDTAMQLPDRLGPRDRLYLTAWSARSRGDEAGVTRALRDIVAAYPEDVEGYWRLGRQLSETDRQIDEAIDVYSRGLALDPYASDIWNAIGFLHNALGQYDRAVAAHERYVALKPNEPNAYDSLATSYTQAGRFEAALAMLDRADSLNPRFHFAAAHRGDVYVLRGRYQEAIRAYERYRGLAPTNWDRAMANSRLAALYLRLRRLDLAEAAANEVGTNHGLGVNIEVALARGDVRGAQRLAEAYFASGRSPEAITARQPEYLRGLLSLRSGRPADALETFTRVLKIKGHEWGIWSVEDCLARAYVELGRWDDAVREYRRILGLNPGEALMHFRLAAAYERAGRPADARQAYQRFLALWADADAGIPEVVAARRALGLPVAN